MFLGLGAGAKPPKYGMGLTIFYDLGALVMLCKINPIVCAFNLPFALEFCNRTLC